ncbi:MAG: hypothetical protein JWL77_5258 [Chthonomonadaceae bacterium]|nr:hypothetical protein [Chthonomonadaceae bacterium]
MTPPSALPCIQAGTYGVFIMTTMDNIAKTERDLPSSPPRQRSPVRRVLRAVAIAVGSLLLVAAIAIATMVRPDIPLKALMPEYGAPGAGQL